MALFTFDSLNLPAFAPPSKPWPKGSEMRIKYGQTVLWWPIAAGGYHWSPEQLEPYRLIGDPRVDAILDELEREGRPLCPEQDLLELARKASPNGSRASDKRLAAFWKHHQELPKWVNIDQLSRGQEVFISYAPAASLSLYYRCLVPGFSIPRIAKVIQSTGYLTSRPDQVLHRLVDTGELTASCIGLGVDSLLPGGVGFITALQVRVLHAKVRRALLKKKDWDTQKYGVPINQEDMAATLLAFSVNVLFGIDFLAGSMLSRQERLDYLALWRYIGWLLGIETDGLVQGLPALDPCGPGPYSASPDPIMHSQSLLQSAIFHLLQPDELSVSIAHHLLKISDRKPAPGSDVDIDAFYKSELFYYRAYQCRRFIGDPLANALELPYHPNIWTRTKLRLKSNVMLFLFRLYTQIAMHCHWIRHRWILPWHRRGMIRFHQNWKETHVSRLRSLMKKTDRQISVCPFAMVTNQNDGTPTEENGK